MLKQLLPALAVTLTVSAGAYGQRSFLDEEAHLPLQRQVTPDGKRPIGYTPQQLKHAYGIDQVANQGDGQVIGIVDAYDYPEVESDLGVFSTAFHLPACTKANGCLTVMYSNGKKPGKNQGWSGETSLDVQWAHAIAPKAKILLMEAPNGKMGPLLRAVRAAAAAGATVINMSWGSPKEPKNEQNYDARYFNNPLVTYINASGDFGHNSFGYPGASPLVVGAGGTVLKLDANGNILSEVGWGGSGGGPSVYFPEPAYQNGFQATGKRGVPDVAYNAAPNTGVPVYDSEAGNWGEVGGTSASSPQWCALTAIANSIRASMGKTTIGANFLNIIYANSTAFHDVTKGRNGRCGADCQAGPGYDFVTGIGSPIAPMVIDALTAAP